MSKPSPKDHPFQNDPKEPGTCKVCGCLEGTHGDGKVTTPTNLSDEGLKNMTRELCLKMEHEHDSMFFNQSDFNHILAALKQVRRESQKDLIERMAQEVCPYCMPKSKYPELHDEKYHTKKGVNPSWENFRCRAEELRRVASTAHRALEGR